MRAKYLIICLLCSLFCTGAILSQPTMGDTITVTGTVTDAQDTTALEGVMVKVVQTQGPTTTVIDSTLTNAQGSYTMTDVPIGIGNYSVTASLAGYIDGTQQIPFNAPDTVTADFSLIQQAGPTGDTTLVSGTVTDSATGDPIQGATVTAVVRIGGPGGGEQTVGTAVTQANGTYQMTVITQRLQADFTATAANYIDQTFANVALDSGLTVDFKLLPAQADTVPVLYTYAGAEVANPRPVFSWQPVNGATTYRIEIATDQNFRNIFITTPVQDTTYTPLIDLADGTYYWRVSSELDYAAYSAVDNLVINTATVFDSKVPLLLTGKYISVFPNPFQGTLGIRIPAGFKAQLSIFDMNGQLVQTLNGRGQILWDGTNSTGNMAQPGMYLVKAVIEGKTFMQKVVLTR